MILSQKKAIIKRDTEEGGKDSGSDGIDTIEGGKTRKMKRLQFGRTKPWAERRQRNLKRSERSGMDLELFFPVPHNTRVKEHGEKCSGDGSKADKRKYFFTQHIITLWNLLPQDVMEAKSIKEFKKED